MRCSLARTTTPFAKSSSLHIAMFRPASTEIQLNIGLKSQTLTITARNGVFPGMLKERTFRVVFAAKDHGVGIPQTEKADQVVHYTSAAIKVRHSQAADGFVSSSEPATICNC
jgi:hypothetical protein